MLGPAPVRWRADSARRLILYRAAESIPGKLTLKGPYGKIEVLGGGQQFVAYGMHRDGSPYLWRPLDPAPYPRETLPAVTEAQICAFLAAVAPLMGAFARKPAAVWTPAAATPIHGHEKDRQTPSERERTYATAALAHEVAQLAAVLPYPAAVVIRR